jgi:hypothetical protein
MNSLLRLIFGGRRGRGDVYGRHDEAQDCENEHAKRERARREEELRRRTEALEMLADSMRFDEPAAERRTE